jgi:hypothetical protein
MRLQNELNQMPLDQIEIFALSNLFAGEEIGLASAKSDNPMFRVIAREKTSAGFYSIIHCSLEGRWADEAKERCWTFDHASLSQRGVFVCWSDDNRTLCLEAFSREGGWPSVLLPEQLSLATSAIVHSSSELYRYQVLSRGGKNLCEQASG